MPEGTDRVTVSSYVPAEQHEIWAEESEALGMSQSEFVRTMVQAGRRGFSLDSDSRTAVEPDVAGSNPGGDGLKTDVLEVLQREGPLEWGELVEALVGDLEDDLDAALTELQTENRVHHRGRQGGYAIAEADGGD